MCMYKTNEFKLAVTMLLMCELLPLSNSSQRMDLCSSAGQSA